MYEHMLDEVHKYRTVFNDSQAKFIGLHNTLHEDFQKRITEMIERTTMIDEVRNLYEKQIELTREDMKRFDLKTERAVRELDSEKIRLKVQVEQLDMVINARVQKIELDFQASQDYAQNLSMELKYQDLMLNKVLPLRTYNQIFDILRKNLTDEKQFNDLIELEETLYSDLQTNLALARDQIPEEYHDRLLFITPQLPQPKVVKEKNKW